MYHYKVGWWRGDLDPFVNVLGSTLQYAQEQQRMKTLNFSEDKLVLMGYRIPEWAEKFGKTPRAEMRPMQTPSCISEARHAPWEKILKTELVPSKLVTSTTRSQLLSQTHNNNQPKTYQTIRIVLAHNYNPRWSPP